MYGQPPAKNRRRTKRRGDTKDDLGVGPRPKYKVVKGDTKDDVGKTRKKGDTKDDVHYKGPKYKVVDKPDKEVKKDLKRANKFKKTSPEYAQSIRAGYAAAPLERRKVILERARANIKGENTPSDIAASKRLYSVGGKSIDESREEFLDSRRSEPQRESLIALDLHRRREERRDELERARATKDDKSAQDLERRKKAGYRPAEVLSRDAIKRATPEFRKAQLFDEPATDFLVDYPIKKLVGYGRAWVEDPVGQTGKTAEQVPGMLAALGVLGYQTATNPIGTAKEGIKQFDQDIRDTLYDVKATPQDEGEDWVKESTKKTGGLEHLAAGGGALALGTGAILGRGVAQVAARAPGLAKAHEKVTRSDADYIRNLQEAVEANRRTEDQVVPPPERPKVPRRTKAAARIHAASTAVERRPAQVSANVIQTQRKTGNFFRDMIGEMIDTRRVKGQQKRLRQYVEHDLKGHPMRALDMEPSTHRLGAVTSPRMAKRATNKDIGYGRADAVQIARGMRGDAEEEILRTAGQPVKLSDALPGRGLKQLERVMLVYGLEGRINLQAAPDQAAAQVRQLAQEVRENRGEVVLDFDDEGNPITAEANPVPRHKRDHWEDDARTLDKIADALEQGKVSTAGLVERINRLESKYGVKRDLERRTPGLDVRTRTRRRQAPQAMGMGERVYDAREPMQRPQDVVFGPVTKQQAKGMEDINRLTNEGIPFAVAKALLRQSRKADPQRRQAEAKSKTAERLKSDARLLEEATGRS
jgi:hypothetical protein